MMLEFIWQWLTQSFVSSTCLFPLRIPASSLYFTFMLTVAVDEESLTIKARSCNSANKMELQSRLKLPARPKVPKFWSDVSMKANWREYCKSLEQTPCQFWQNGCNAAARENAILINTSIYSKSFYYYVAFTHLRPSMSLQQCTKIHSGNTNPIIWLKLIYPIRKGM